jgi:putative acetyltransferase
MISVSARSAVPTAAPRAQPTILRGGEQRPPSLTTMPTAWTTRPETSADIPAVRAIVAAAFETPAEADLVDALRADAAWIDGLSVVAVDQAGEVVGHALLTRCHIDATPALCLAPCAVRPDHQRTGAGSAAIRAALRAATERGEHHVVVLGHPAYYPRFGFTRASTYGIRLSIDVRDEALMAPHGSRGTPAGDKRDTDCLAFAEQPRPRRRYGDDVVLGTNHAGRRRPALLPHAALRRANGSGLGSRVAGTTRHRRRGGRTAATTRVRSPRCWCGASTRRSSSGRRPRRPRPLAVPGR